MKNAKNTKLQKTAKNAINTNNAKSAKNTISSLFQSHLNLQVPFVLDCHIAELRF